MPHSPTQHPKRKIVNDPVHGFITIPEGLPRQLIDHPALQRLRGITQLGLTSLVYPGATHTRFQHALGAMHLISAALDTLQKKGYPITPQEQQAAAAAILLHDAGHGPMSHALEHALIPHGHEQITLAIMHRLNHELNGQLDLAIAIFRNQHPKPYLHQLISSQLDVDRMDYLLRDSFFTGVVEGKIPADRLIKMLEIHNEDLALEYKALYSIESFLLARRVMYWQVYLHKTVIISEQLLRALLTRAREIAQENGQAPPCTPTLADLLTLAPKRAQMLDDDLLDRFLAIDDSDLYLAIKTWQQHPDPTLSTLAQAIHQRRLPRLYYTRQPAPPELINTLRQAFHTLHPHLPPLVAERLIVRGTVRNRAYQGKRTTDESPRQSGRPSGSTEIKLLTPQGEAIALAEASRLITPEFIAQDDSRNYLIVPKELDHLIPPELIAR
ncbi:MAG: phosphohydrolase [Bacteroidetes bacterium]|nr:MAG: phosphohydrolase [Bacteroidota bacterium]